MMVPGNIVYSNALPSYNALDVPAFRHFQLSYSKSFVKSQTELNGIENFWNQAQRVLRKYNGIPAKSFYLFLKECEFRFNYDSPKQQLSTLRKWCNL